MGGERIPVRFVEICSDSSLPILRLIDTEVVSPDVFNVEEIEHKFRVLVESHCDVKQFGVFWETPSVLIACEAVRDSHLPRQLCWLHRGLAERLN